MSVTPSQKALNKIILYFSGKVPKAMLISMQHTHEQGSKTDPCTPRKLKYIGKKLIKYIKIDLKSRAVLLGSLSVAGFSKQEREGEGGFRNKEPQRHWGGRRPFCCKQNS